MTQFDKRAGEMASHAPRGLPVSFLAVAALLLTLSMLVRTINHDESQYVAAIALVREGLPYRDFAYLQTPLQPLFLAPLAYLPAGWTFVGTRAANAVFGFGTLLLLGAALRQRASSRTVLVALAALLCTDAFLLASSLARNDALMMVLLAAALPPLLSGTETRSGRMFALGGLCLGLATSAKINAALPAAGAGLFILARLRHLGARTLLSFAAGLLAGLLPTLILATIAPHEFRFDVFVYNLAAPAQWWASIGEGAELRPLERVLKLVGQASLGSILVALAATSFDRKDSDDRRILDFMIVGALVAAYLPAPALTQYLIPLLPPLFTRFGLALDDCRGRQRTALYGLAALGSIAGLTSSFVIRFSRLEVIESVPLGREAAKLAGNGEVVTLSPEYFAGDGLTLDPRFAAGPFLFRTRGQLARMAEDDGRAITIASIDGALALRQPSVIIVGRETQPFPPVFPAGLDGPLVGWAKDRGYRSVPLNSGFEALVKPR